MTSSSGEPGAGAYIQIRGAASIVGGTQPLFIVDGPPIDNSSVSIGTAASIDATNLNSQNQVAGTVVRNRTLDLNPNDIESIDLLKGVAATAIYGSRAANGVVSSCGRGSRISLYACVRQEISRTRGAVTTRSRRHGSPYVSAACTLLTAAYREGGRCAFRSLRRSGSCHV